MKQRSMLFSGIDWCEKSLKKVSALNKLLDKTKELKRDGIKRIQHFLIHKRHKDHIRNLMGNHSYHRQQIVIEKMQNKGKNLIKEAFNKLRSAIKGNRDYLNKTVKFITKASKDCTNSNLGHLYFKLKQNAYFIRGKQYQKVRAKKDVHIENLTKNALGLQRMGINRLKQF